MKTMQPDSMDTNASPTKLNSSKHRNSMKSIHNYNSPESKAADDKSIKREPFVRIPKRIGELVQSNGPFDLVFHLLSP
jgi:hypothetical protein